MKKFLAILTTAAMLLSLAVIGTSATADVWDGTIATSFAGGSGTEADPYVIATASELAYLAQQVQAGTHYTGEYFVLASDINLAKLEWTPIGIYIKSGNAANSPFEGSFDGKGYTVSGISITTTDSGIYLGLFGHIVTEGYIKNLVIADSNITTDSANSEGALAGRIQAKELSSIIVKEDVVVSGTASVGGIAGRLKGVDAKYLVNYATVNGTKIDSSVFCGGIAGTLGGGSTLSYSANYGSVSGVGAFNGGLVGITASDSGIGSMNNCVNYGDIAYNGEKAWFAGGISGCFAHSGGYDNVYEYCYNLGTVSAGYAGAFPGEITGVTRNTGVTMISCYSIDLENVELIGEDRTPGTVTDVVNKTADEIKVLADAIIATIEENIIDPSAEPEVTEPEVTEPEVTEPEVTEPEVTVPEVTVPETTEPGSSSDTGDATFIFAAIAILSITAVAVVAKKREN